MITGTVPVKVPEKLSELELDAGGRRIDNLGLGDTPDDVMRRSEKTGDYEVYGLLAAGLAANRPAPGIIDRFYFSTDTLVLERDTGAAWVEVVRGETAIRLAQLAERAHSSLTGIGASDHHVKYTDAEAQAQAAALLTIHAAIAAAHHTKTTDAAEITSGTFPVARGGTGLNTIALGGILYASALDTLSRLAPTAANQVLRSTAANALQFAALVAADIPNLAASKITSGRFPVDRLPAMTDEKIWKGTGGNVEEVDMPVGDMAKATYDPDADGKIALAQLVDAVCSETEADNKIAARVPSGLIVMWHGTIANIPAGYVICDGNNNTPNLLAKFVEGVATAGTNPGATGGAKAKTTSGHSHPRVDDQFARGVYSDYRGTATDTISDIRPPYYDIAFLMKT